MMNQNPQMLAQMLRSRAGFGRPMPPQGQPAQPGKSAQMPPPQMGGGRPGKSAQMPRPTMQAPQPPTQGMA